MYYDEILLYSLNNTISKKVLKKIPKNVEDKILGLHEEMLKSVPVFFRKSDTEVIVDI